MWKANAQQQMEAVASSFSSVQNHAQTRAAYSEAEVQELRDAAATWEAESTQLREKAILAQELQGMLPNLKMSVVFIA